MFKIKIIFNFVEFMAAKRGKKINYILPSCFLLLLIRYGKKSGSGIVIPDPQHWTATMHRTRKSRYVPGIEELVIVCIFYLTASCEELGHLVQRAQESARVQEPHPLLHRWVLEVYSEALGYWKYITRH
jgi:hypothetical protein